MTPSVDPNKKHLSKSQISDTYDWNALISKSADSKKLAPNHIQACLTFLNRFISYESIYGDSVGAREMSRVLLLLQAVDSPVTGSQIKQTRNSYEYVRNYLDLLHETDAPFDVCFEFERLCFVLEALIRMRKQTELGVMCSYGQLNQHLICGDFAA